MCLYPTLRDNPKYRKNKKNGGNIPAVHDNRVLLVPTGCGKCIECRKQYANGWKIRLLEEIKNTTEKGYFVTLTFSNESIIKIIEQNKEEQKRKSSIKTRKKINIDELEGYDVDNEIATQGVRKFLERYRKKYNYSPKHWLITELGHTGTKRIHLHGVIWCKEGIESIRERWNYGWIYPRSEEEAKKTTLQKEL